MQHFEDWFFSLGLSALKKTELHIKLIIITKLCKDSTDIHVIEVRPDRYLFLIFFYQIAGNEYKLIKFLKSVFENTNIDKSGKK